VDCVQVINVVAVFVGDYICVKDAYWRNWGCEQKFWKIAMRPGKPVRVWRREGKKLVFAVAGHSVSAAVDVSHPGAPCVAQDAMLGRNRNYLRRGDSGGEEDFVKRSDRVHI